MDNVINGIKYFKKQEDTQELVKEIIDIGHGIYENKENDEALEIYSGTEAVKNKKEWTEISKNNTDIAKFNPYIKENFLRMSALDIYRVFSNRIKSYANLQTMPPEEFMQNLEEAKKSMLQTFKDRGYDAKIYYEFVERLDEDCKSAINIHSVKNSEYTYRLVLAKNAEDLAYLLTDKKTFQEMKQTVDEKISECLELGIPKTDVINIVISGFREFISQNAQNIDIDIVLQVLQEVLIEDEKFAKLVLNFDKLVINTVENAVRLYSERQKEISDREYFIKYQNKLLALKEFLVWYKSNKNTYPDDIDKVILNLIEKYSINENSYLYAVLEKKTILKDFQKLNSFIIVQFERMSLNGQLRINEIESALIQGYISSDDALKFIENLNKPIKPEVLQIEKSFDERVLKDNAELLMKRAWITIDLGNEKINLEEAQKKLKELTKNSK